eukprot:COSAG02_NODE_1412_length_12756_cov_57.891048_10_plen_111_part_00
MPGVITCGSACDRDERLSFARARVARDSDLHQMNANIFAINTYEPWMGTIQLPMKRLCQSFATEGDPKAPACASCCLSLSLRPSDSSTCQVCSPNSGAGPCGRIFGAAEN